MKSLPRFATGFDLPEILAKLRELLEKSPAPQMKYVEVDVATARIKEAWEGRRLAMFGGYMVMFDVGGDWYTSKRMLIEQLILKVYPEVKDWSLDDVIGLGLDYLHDLHNCSGIVVGDTQIGYMTPKYLANGFKVLGTQLFKEGS